MIEGDLDEFAEKYGAKCNFLYFDVDEFEDLAQEEEIAQMPSFKIFKKDGNNAEYHGTKAEKI